MAVVACVMGSERQGGGFEADEAAASTESGGIWGGMASFSQTGSFRSSVRFRGPVVFDRRERRGSQGAPENIGALQSLSPLGSTGRRHPASPRSLRSLRPENNVDGEAAAPDLQPRRPWGAIVRRENPRPSLQIPTSGANERTHTPRRSPPPSKPPRTRPSPSPATPSRSPGPARRRCRTAQERTVRSLRRVHPAAPGPNLAFAP